MKTNVIVDVFTEKTSISIKDENTYGVEVFAVGDNVMVNVSDTPNEIIVTTDEVVAISLYDEDLFNRTGGVNLGDADTLDGYHALAFPRKIEKATITGEWDFTNKIGIKVPYNEAKEADFQNEGSSILQGKVLFGSDLESRDGFVSGFSGSGFRYDYQTGHMTIDNLTVRKMMRVYELLISQIRASNGSIWVSDAAKIKDVVETTLYWRCIIDSDSGSVAIPYRENDLIRCQRWTGKGVKYYSAKVIGIGSDYFDVEKLSIDGLDIPEAGDDTVRIGNTTDTNRQGAIYITSSDDYAPYIDVMDGVNSYDFADRVKVRLGRLNGISFQGKELEGYGAFMQNAYLTGAAQSANGKWQLNADGSGSLAGGSITWTAEGVMTFTSITDYVTEEIAAFGTMVSESLALFQSQIDQKAEYWFQENDPSVNWTTENTKAAHVGDRWYKASTRQAWTWNGATWDAVGVTDPIYAAMVNANEAQDTADGKRTVFVAQPYTPYKIGDLWLKEESGKPGEILRCQTERGDTESFAIADWILASKYTDDTTANKKSKTYIGGTWDTRPDQHPTQWTDAEIINNIGDVWLRDDTRLNPATGLEETTQVAMRWTGLAWMDDATSIDGGRINTASIKAGSIDVDTLLANRILLKSEGSAIGGFDIQATSLKLGTQATHHPAENQEGIWMGKVPEDYGDGLPRYKFFVGNALQNILFNGENLIISGRALLGDESDNYPIGNLGVLSKWFTVMNPGLANEYLKVNGSVAATGEVSAYRGEEGVFPPSLWEAMPLAGATIVGGIKIGAGLSIDANGIVSVTSQGTIQTLSLNGTTLSISGGNSVMIPATYTDVMARAACALSGTVYDSARLGGVAASSYTRRDVAETIAQAWTFSSLLKASGSFRTNADNTYIGCEDSQAPVRLGIVKKEGARAFFATGSVGGFLWKTSDNPGINDVVNNNYTELMNLTNGGDLKVVGKFISTSITASKILVSDSAQGIIASSVPSSFLTALDIMFELVPNSGNPYIRAKYNFASIGEVTAYAAGGAIETIWESMPLATTTSKGGIIIGSGFNYAGGVLSVDSSYGAQTLSLAGTTLSLTGGGSVSLASLATSLANLSGIGTGWSTFLASTKPTTRSGYGITDAEGTITAGTATQYWRGDKTWQSLNTSAVTEGTNLYFSDARARSACASIGTVYDSARLGGMAATEYARKTANETISGAWSFSGNVGFGLSGSSQKVHVRSTTSGGCFLVEAVNGGYANIDIVSDRSTVGMALGGVRYFNSSKQYAIGEFGCVASGGAFTWAAGSGTVLPSPVARLSADGIFWTKQLSIDGDIIFGGSVGIGVTSLSARLHISNASLKDGLRVDQDAASYNAAYLYNSNISGNGVIIRAASGTNTILSLRDYNNNVKATILGNGNMSLSGNFTATGEVTAYSASDNRLKTNIKTITNAGDILRQLRAVEYDWNEAAMRLNPAKRDAPHSVSFIAQEWEEVLPWATHSIFGKYKSIDLNVMTGYLVAGWNEHDKEINKLRQRVSELEKQLNKP